MKKIAVTIFLLFAVFLSGCLGGGESAPVGTGVEIISFASDSSIVDSGDTFNVDLLIQNTGDSEAKRAQADLVQKSNFVILQNKKVQLLGSLSAADKTGKVEGDEAIASWPLEAPAVSANQLKTVSARITYDYSSNATSNIYVVPKSEYGEKGAESFGTYSTFANAPVLLEIQAMPAFRTRIGQGNVGVVADLSINNVGGGRIIGNIKNFRLILSNSTTGKTTDYTKFCKDVDNGEIELVGKEQSRSLRCEFQLPAKDFSESYIVDASMDYTYYIDTEPLSIRINR